MLRTTFVRVYIEINKVQSSRCRVCCQRVCGVSSSYYLCAHLPTLSARALEGCSNARCLPGAAVQQCVAFKVPQTFPGPHCGFSRHVAICHPTSCVCVFSGSKLAWLSSMALCCTFSC